MGCPDRSFILFRRGRFAIADGCRQGFHRLVSVPVTAPRGHLARQSIVWSTMGKRRTGRPGYKPIEGAENRLHRRLKEGSSTEWTRSASGGKDTEYDSLCHRHVREVGAFLRDDDASIAAAAAASVNAVAASGAAASSARDNDSKKALEHQGRLECFVLKHAANTEFGKFIQALRDIVGDGSFPTAAHRANRISTCRWTLILSQDISSI